MSSFQQDVEAFKDRKIKASDIFYIKLIPKNTAYEFIRRYHYLGNAKFFSVYCFGLFYKPTTELVGCATFSLPQGTCSTMGWFGLGTETKNILELSRLCMLPCLNNTNATSFLLGGSIKQFREMNNDARCACKREGRPFTQDDWICRAVITLALAERHAGSIYQVCNFQYYGMTSSAQDFFDETGGVNKRGKISEMHGVWMQRAKKHRYAYILDPNLKCNYEKQERPQRDNLQETIPCCNGKKIVYDRRFNEWWTCPICTGKLVLVDSLGNPINNPRILGKDTTRKKKEYDDSFSKFSFDDLL